MADFIEDFYYGNIEPQECNSELNADCFISGFRLGAKFTYDTFVKKQKG